MMSLYREMPCICREAGQQLLQCVQLGDMAHVLEPRHQNLINFSWLTVGQQGCRIPPKLKLLAAGCVCMCEHGLRG